MRRNSISLPSARRWLSLLSQNKRITTFEVDEGTPKRILLQRQCLANANMCVYVSNCVICQKSMLSSSQQQAIEKNLLLRIHDRMGSLLDSLSGTSFELMFKSLAACTEANDGILFLCSPECIQQLADDCITACVYVKHGRNHSVRPKCHIVAALANETLEKMESAALNVSDTACGGKPEGEK